MDSLYGMFGGRVSQISSGARGLFGKTLGSRRFRYGVGAAGALGGAAYGGMRYHNRSSARGGLRGRSSGGGVAMSDLTTTGNTLLVDGQPTRIYT